MTRGARLWVRSGAVLGIALVSLLLALGLKLARERRVGKRAASVAPGDALADPLADPPSQQRRAALAWLLGAVTLANLPLLLAAPRLLVGRLPPDAFSHAVVAQAIARKGLPHGWVDVYDGGFPFGIHYQSVALLVDAALIKLGIPALLATNALGLAALLAAPLAFAWAAYRSGLHPLASLGGAIALTAVAPEHPMVGGWESYASQGLLSQVFTIPILIACARFLVSPDAPARSRRWLVALSALAVAAHTQVTIVAFAAGLVVVLAAGTAEIRRRFFVASAAAAVAALALYGTGALTFKVPFGSPRGALWRLLGFSFDRMTDGDFLDQDRAPILTAAWIAAAMFLLPFARSRVCRGALVFVVFAEVVTFGRDAFLQAGKAAYALFELEPPARMMAVVPLAVALVVAVALHELDARAGALVTFAAFTRFTHAAPRWLRRVPLAFGVAALAVLLLPSRARWARELAAGVASLSGDHECGAGTPSGYATRLAADWIHDLDRGRFSTDVASFPDACPAANGLDLASPVPLGNNVGGPGSQVGVLVAAYVSLDLAAPGSAARAEVLGVRDVLASREHASREPTWREREAKGDTVLLERTGGTDLIGVGCVGEEWAGGDGALPRRGHVRHRRARPDAWFSNPTSLVALTGGKGPVQRRAVERAGCDASGATVAEHPREPGAYEAVVTSPSDVDVVVRATYFATWEVKVDGAAVPNRRVAPGFVSARVPAGAHRVEATVQLPRGSLAALVVACACLVFLARPRQMSPRSRT